MAYCTTVEVRERAHGQLSGWPEAHLLALLEAVSWRIAAETGREFTPGAVESRVYEVYTSGFVTIDDVVTLQEVAYARGPAGTFTVCPVAGYRVRCTAGGSIWALLGGPWLGGDYVRATGVFGYAATVPADVREAAIEWALRTLKAADGAYQDATAIPELGQLVYQKAMPAEVRRVLDRYTRPSPVTRVV